MFCTIPFYKGFEIETLVFPCQTSDASQHDRRYDVAVRISRSGAPEGSGSRVFKLDSRLPFESFGDARRAGDRYGQSIVDGTIESLSVKDL